MSWHYQIRRRKIGKDKRDWWYDIVEVYTKPLGWTKNSMAPSGISRKDVSAELEMMLRDAKRHKTLTDVKREKDVQNIDDDKM